MFNQTADLVSKHTITQFLKLVMVHPDPAANVLEPIKIQICLVMSG